MNLWLISSQVVSDIVDDEHVNTSARTLRVVVTLPYPGHREGVSSLLGCHHLRGQAD